MKDHDFYAGIDFAVNVLAHDVRSPLTTMGMFLYALEKNQARRAPLPAEKLSECAKMVDRARKNVNHIIADLALLNPNIHLEKEACSLEELALAGASQMLNTAQQMRFNWQRTYVPNVDKHKMQRVFSHLLRLLMRGCPSQLSLCVTACDQTYQGLPVTQVCLERDPDLSPKPSTFREKSYDSTPFSVAVCEHVIAAHGGTLQLDLGGGKAVLLLPAL